MPLNSWLKLILPLLVAVFIGVGGGSLYSKLINLPEIKCLANFAPIESSFVLSSDEKILAELFIERRSFVPHYKIPDSVKEAFIAIEDHRFFSHPGIDIVGISRALYRSIRAQRIVEGGSTITQQLARTLFLTPERTLSRKIKEAIIAIQLEKRYTKEEILGMYLNQIYFGTRAYGIEAAAYVYFGKSVNELSLAEAAMLAALPRAPNLYSPFRNPERALQRRQLVLMRMLDNGFISREEYEQAMVEPLPVRPNHRQFNAPFFVEFLKQQLEAKHGEKVYTAGLKIHSTLSYRMQRIAEEAIRNGVNAIEGRARSGVQAALIAIDPRNGHIKAMVGGTDFWETQFNRATMALRQPGSAFKPFVYLAAFKDGWSEGDKIFDGPFVCWAALKDGLPESDEMLNSLLFYLPTPGGGILSSIPKEAVHREDVFFYGTEPNTIWSPQNFGSRYHGYVSLRKAHAMSLNTATVRLAYNVGLDNIIKTAKRSGIKSRIHPYPSLVLGASCVTLLELTLAYGVFATGNRVKPIAYKKVIDREGILLERNLPSSKKVLGTETIDKMRDLLRTAVTEGTARRAQELDRDVFGKTGSTNDFADAWFIGFDDELVVGVWVGRDLRKSIGHRETGARAALPIWVEFMKNIKADDSISAEDGKI
ncbi:transglycosylase domain-containing protein [Thermodesulfovibrionales bacterium]|nr:transglycosylase domain-containing protein [Thermodesulfovibrionales bacterium]